MSARLTKEEVRKLPGIEKWNYLLYLVVDRVCIQVCPNQEEWNDWRCKGCPMRMLSERGSFYYSMMWKNVLRNQVLYVNKYSEGLVEKTKLLHSTRFVPTMVYRKAKAIYQKTHTTKRLESVWFILDQKTHKTFDLKKEKYKVGKMCQALNSMLTWTATEEDVKLAIYSKV